jgi:hypothetical protein
LISTTRDKAPYATYVLVETAMLRKNVKIFLLYVLVCDYLQPEGLGCDNIMRSTLVVDMSTSNENIPFYGKWT